MKQRFLAAALVITFGISLLFPAATPVFGQIPGTKKWEFMAGAEISSSPAIGTDGTIYVGSWNNNLYAINPDGTKNWQFPTLGRIESSPTIALDGTIYIGSDDSRLYAIYSDSTGFARSS